MFEMQIKMMGALQTTHYNIWLKEKQKSKNTSRSKMTRMIQKKVLFPLASPINSYHLQNIFTRIVLSENFVYH